VATGKLRAASQAYAFLHAVFATAVDDDAVHQNPCRIAGAGQPNSPERPLIDLDDLDRLTAAMPEHMRALTTLAFWACLRIGEVVALRRGDVWLSDDLSTGKVRIDRQETETKDGPVEKEPKTGSSGTIPLPKPAIDALAEHLAISAGSSLPGARLFTHPDARPLRAHDIENRWTTARKVAGLPVLTSTISGMGARR
jgi:integrase